MPEEESNAEELPEPANSESNAEVLSKPTNSESNDEELPEPTNSESNAEELPEPMNSESNAEELPEPTNSESNAEELPEPTNSESNAEDLPEPTNSESGTIKAIGDDTVHRICSGQVVLSLAVTVKELVENAIDAGATLVEVKLRDQGLESMEVIDNGSGVNEHDLEAMTAKYHTSKLREFVDLQGVETFGFRGEALSSLCALADMCIVTRHKSTDIGTRIELDHDGKIKKRVPCARSVGTTVSLSNLFATLPVRRRDFVRNIKKEFNKMCQMLQAYCLVSKGVRIICTNQTAKSSRLMVMQTHGANDVQANIAAVFGSKQVADLLPLKSPLSNGALTLHSLRADLQADASSDKLQISAADVECLNAGLFELEGYISSCCHGAGRSAKDRQYLYINSRPCDHKNIAKLINETYHRFNTQQNPFVYLNVITARSDVDVNLTPDKRQLLLNNEKILLLAIKKALLDAYANVPSTYKRQNSTIVSMFKKENGDAADDSANTTQTDESELVPVSSTQRFMDVLSQWKKTGNTIGKAPRVTLKRKHRDEVETRTLKMKKIQKYLSKEYDNTPANANGKNDSKMFNAQTDSESDNEADISTKLKAHGTLNISAVDLKKINKESAEFDALTGKQLNDDETEYLVERIVCKVEPTSQGLLNSIELKTEPHEDTFQANSDAENELIFSLQSPHRETITLDNSTAEDESASNYFFCGAIRTTLEDIAANVMAEELLVTDKRSKTKLDRLRFKSEINPSQNQNAEAELAREITKETFSRMEIIGQFNLGFIVVKLDTDIFIIDQHATDEKYNFEILQRTTVLQSQPLAIAQTLEMTAANEILLLENLEIFEKNGFKFEINEDATPTKRVKLLCKPSSERWEFGKNDIDELLFMLQDAPPDTICRPSRIREMFASRACRKSVMIGKALKKSTMKTLVTHMGEIEQPWNCPHGRPTMRHLINIAMLEDEDEGTSEHN